MSGEGFSPWELSSEFTNWLSEVRPPGVNSFVSHQEMKHHFAQCLPKIGGSEFRQTLRAAGLPVGKALFVFSIAEGKKNSPSVDYILTDDEPVWGDQSMSTKNK